MANNNNDHNNKNEESPKDTGLDKSIVGKLVSGLINRTPLSKWFGRETATPSTIRKRDEDDEDEDSYNLQPPSKRSKIPQANNYNSFCDYSYIPKSNTYASFAEPVAGPSGIYRGNINFSTASTNTVENSWGPEGNVSGSVDYDSDDDGSTSEHLAAPRGPLSRHEQQQNQEQSVKGKKIVKNIVKSDSSNVTQDYQESTERSETNTPTRSLFFDRPLDFGYRRNTNTSLSSRRPTFNASVFGSTSPTSSIDSSSTTKHVDKSNTPDRSKLLESPFYRGQTTYGGASAYRRKLNEKSVVAKKLTTKIQPVNQTKTNSEPNMALSKTARRILSAIEQYSEPLNDAKKTPLDRKGRSEGILSKYIGARPYLVSRTSRPGPPTKSLQVPTVPELLKMKQKLQNSTENARQIASNSQSSLNQDYALGSDKQKYTGKMKTSISSIRQKTQTQFNETLPEVNLPQISLPITTLPKFDLNIPPPQQQPQTLQQPERPQQQPQQPQQQSQQTQHSQKQPEQSQQSQRQPEQPQHSQQQANETEFRFSNPLVIAENLKTVIAMNNFKFSEPLAKNKDKDVNTVKSRNNGEIVTNKKDDNFGVQFKLTKDKWECKECFVRNSIKDTKCIACGVEKIKPVNTSNTLKPVKEPCDNKTADLLSKFKPAANSWECPTCMIRNNADVTKCAACQTCKPGTETKENNDDLMSKFKPASGSWECTTCMIRNKEQDLKCVACETDKPGHKSATKSLKPDQSFSFGIKPKSSGQSAGQGFMFGTKDVGKTDGKDASKGFTFGVMDQAKTSGQNVTKGFSFGVQNTTKTDEQNTTKSSTFGVKDSKKTDAAKSLACSVKDAEKTDNKSSAFGGQNPIRTDEQSKIKSFNFAPKTDDESTTKGSPFGVPNQTIAKGLMFGAKDSTKTDDQNKTKGFALGVQTTAKTGEQDASKSFSFVGKDAAKVDTSNATPSFAFGVPNPPAKTGNQTTSSRFAFGSPSTVKADEQNVSKGLTLSATKPNFNLKPVDSWECKSCSLRNPDNIDKCKGCKTGKPSGFGDNFKLKSTQWECTSCLVRNSQESSKCMCCGSDRFFGRTETTEMQPIRTLNFGVTNGPKFQFGLLKNDQTNAGDDKKREETTEKEKINPLLKANEKLPEKAEPAALDFKFMAPRQKEVEKAVPPPPKFEFSKPVKFPVNGDLSLEKTNEKKEMFLNNPSVIQPPSSSFSFGETKPPATATAANTTNLFKLNTPSSSTAIATANNISFSLPTTNNNNNNNNKRMFNMPETQNKFVFGNTESVPKKIPNFSFGEKSTAGFNFGSTTSAATTSASTSSTTGFNFTPTVPSFNFTSNEIKEVAPPPPSATVTAFGAFPTTVASAKNGIFNFGSSATNTNNSQKAVFNFGANQPTSVAAPTLSQTGFNFGATPNATSATSGFNYTGAPPTFNFTDGNPGQLQGQPQTHRKMRKAVRRTHR